MTVLAVVLVRVLGFSLALEMVPPDTFVAVVAVVAVAALPVHDPDDPVVFWLSVGISATTTVLNVGTPPEPLGAAKKVLAFWKAKFEGVTASVPPKVIVPVVVIVPPVSVKPLTVPDVATDVTVPLPVPAPIAVRNDAASNVDTVLSALNLGNAIAATFGTVNTFAPRVVAPRLVLAPAAAVAPVPPFATATVPVTFADVPVTLIPQLPEAPPPVKVGA